MYGNSVAEILTNLNQTRVKKNGTNGPTKWLLEKNLLKSYYDINDFYGSFQSNTNKVKIKGKESFVCAVSSD